MRLLQPLCCPLLSPSPPNPWVLFCEDHWLPSAARTGRAAVTGVCEWEGLLMDRHFQENSIHLMKNSAGQKGWKCNLAEERQEHRWCPRCKLLARQELLTATSTSTGFGGLYRADCLSLCLKKFSKHLWAAIERNTEEHPQPTPSLSHGD